VRKKRCAGASQTECAPCDVGQSVDRGWAAALGALLLLLSCGGCIGVANWILWGIKGEKVPAQYTGLRNQRVAIVCATANSPFEPGGVTGMIARQVAEILQREVKGISIVPLEDVADWIDRNDWASMDYREVGRGVKANKVLAVEFERLSFQDGPTTVRGRADFSVSVFDVASGQREFHREVPEHIYPTQAPSTMSPRQFQLLYIRQLANHIAEYFYDHDFTQKFGLDALAN
jgi:hypothetical protein